jgi:hypothetical protein
MRNSIKALLVTSLLTTGACGGGPDGKALSRFVGVWSATAGTTTTTCSGASNTSPVSGNLTWSAGTTSDLIYRFSDSSCIIHADVDGDTASEVGAQNCLAAGTDSYSGDPLALSYSFTAYTFVVSGDGHTATENLSGTLLLTDNQTGLNNSCTFTETAGSYQKE